MTGARRFSDVCTAIASSGHLLTDDPADLLDELVYDITKPPESRALDALAGWLFNTLAEHPMTHAHLVRWVRIQRPRILPESIGQALLELQRSRLIEVGHGDRWFTRQLQGIGLVLGRRAA